MRPPKAFPEGTKERLQALLDQTENPEERKRIQAVLMRAEVGASPTQIATVTGLAFNSVRILHSRFLREGISCLIGRHGRGGSRRSPITPEQEREFCEAHTKEFADGRVFSIGELQQAFYERFASPISAVSLYRMLTRNDCKKIIKFSTRKPRKTPKTPEPEPPKKT